MNLEKNSNALMREVASRLKKLADFGPMIDGSVVVIHRRCGKPGCRCADGEKHPATHLTRKVGKKNEAIYIPAELVEEVRIWQQEHQRLKKLVSEICERQRMVVKLIIAERRRKGL
jgi:hypothetical protein